MKFVLSIVIFPNRQETGKHMQHSQKASNQHVLIRLPHCWMFYNDANDHKKGFSFVSVAFLLLLFSTALRDVRDPVSRHLANPRHRNQLKPRYPNCEIVRFGLITFNLFYSVPGLFGSAINAQSVTPDSVVELGHGGRWRVVRIWLLSGVVGCEIYGIVSWVRGLSEITRVVQGGKGGCLNKSYAESVFPH